MAVDISKVYISTFERTLRHLAQQSITRLRPYVTERATNGKDHGWERLSAATSTSKGAGLTPTPSTGGTYSRRLSLAQTIHAGDSTEQEDIVQMLIDPNSNQAASLAMAIRRAWDVEILTAATGAAIDGDGVAVPFDTANQQIVAATDITFDLVTQVQERFLDNNIEPDVPKVFVIGPKQVRKLMQLTEQTSSDYVNTQALQTLNNTGIVYNWMGFTWIMSTLLNVTAGAPDTIDCIAFTKRGLGMQMNRDMLVRVAEDPTQSFAWRIYCATTFGVVRTEDEHLVWLQVQNT
ncbi:MAG: phage capsid protein [Thiohalomonadales bacterium]